MPTGFTETLQRLFVTVGVVRLSEGVAAFSERLRCSDIRREPQPIEIVEECAFEFRTASRGIMIFYS